MKTTLLALALTAVGTAGCASWEPVIDRQVDPHPETVDRDLEQCRRLAKQASGEAGDKAVKGGALGAAGGAAIGAMLGAIGGDAGGTAALGAVVGGVGGSASQGLSSSDQFRVSYTKCLEGRGHRLIN